MAKTIWIGVLCVIAMLAGRARADEPRPVELHWLDGAPATAGGASWGVPWPRGAIKPGTAFSLTDAHGKDIALQTWPLAYWPDGSLKWTGNAAVTTDAGPFQIHIGKTAAPADALQVEQDDRAITITNGKTTYRINKTGAALIESIALGDKIVAKDGKLICVLEDRSDYDAHQTIREKHFESAIASAVVEQNGPVRAVVKIEGKHHSQDGRAWLPFAVRFYFYVGVDSVQIVHSFVFDGDGDKDFIRGLGVRFTVPMREEFHNRHVRLSGETGMLAEPLQLIAGRRNPAPDLYAKQIAGQAIPNLAQLPNHENIADMAVWDGYKLTQISSDSYSMQKRTNPKSAWVEAAGGTRAMGTVFVGDTSGGLSIGMKNFWQQSPTGIEIENASTHAAEMTLWLWSPDSPAMDLRHYDTKAHGLEASYEDYQDGFSTATGVARTNELMICPFAAVPSNRELADLAKQTANPARLVCSPDYYHSIPIFGVWSLPDRSTPSKKWIEQQLDDALSFYQGEIDRRRWYGFWDYGDVMHTYDTPRHEWKYDVGGFAWDNSELVPDLWLWYSFLRSGRGDVFKMAEALTRNTQEVDVYHLGRFAGLGSRHNVRHWGCGAEELRISQALLKRFYYYLTTDERTGDLMNEVIDADQTLVEVDPMRHIEPKSQYPTHMRIGPDWLAAASNWFTAWERTGDTKYRDRILIGMACIEAMPHRFFSGDSCGYDPATKKLYAIHDNVDIAHLAALMGGPEFCMEMSPLIDDPKWTAAWLNYCRYLQAPAEEQRKGIGGTVTNGRGPWFTRMTAYAAYAEKDPQLAKRAWTNFLGRGQDHFTSRRVDSPDVPSLVIAIPNLSTNDTAQWCLNAIELLQLVGKDMPAVPAGSRP